MDDALEPVTGTVERLPRDATNTPGVTVLPPTPPAAAPAGPPADDGTMSLVDHLGELRHRLAISILAVVIGAAIGFWFAPQIIVLLAQPVPTPVGGGAKLQFLTVTGPFLNYSKIAIVFGILVGLPVILYELWRFVSPGLTPHERRTALPWIPLSVLFFVLGVLVSWFTLPFALQFLTSWTVPGITVSNLTGESYFGFVTTMFIIFGAVMEFPIALVLLHKLGILSIEKLRSSRRMVILGIVIFAVVATPGGDPISPVVMAGVMYLLFEFTIFMLQRSDRSRPVAAATAAPAAPPEDDA
jgi:sec-independent protein translocase protein TatC